MHSGGRGDEGWGPSVEAQGYVSGLSGQSAVREEVEQEASPGQALGLGASSGESSAGSLCQEGERGRVAQERPSSSLGAGEA